MAPRTRKPNPEAARARAQVRARRVFILREFFEAQLLTERCYVRRCRYCAEEFLSESPRFYYCGDCMEQFSHSPWLRRGNDLTFIFPETKS